MKAMVTGATGFLGGWVARRLLAEKHQVRILARRAAPELAKAGAEVHPGDLSDKTAVAAACKGVDAVFHVAAKAGYWGDYETYFESNVVGTRNVLAGCWTHKVRKLVFTSSASVVFAGKDIHGGNEDLPYPEHPETAYTATKAIAEREVLEANAKGGLFTVALRPHLIWGPGDTQIVPRILARARAGQLKRVGDGTNKVDVIYVENAARAHLSAAEKLEPGSVAAGKPYFISQGQPVNLWDFIDRILVGFGAPKVASSMSLGLAEKIGLVLELAYRLPLFSGEPRMTRFLARELATSHWFDISRARRELHYLPWISTDEGLKRLFAAGRM